MAKPGGIRIRKPPSFRFLPPITLSRNFPMHPNPIKMLSFGSSLHNLSKFLYVLWAFFLLSQLSFTLGVYTYIALSMFSLASLQPGGYRKTSSFRFLSTPPTPALIFFFTFPLFYHVCWVCPISWDRGIVRPPLSGDRA